jgi:molecular chaperone HtpG
VDSSTTDKLVDKDEKVESVLSEEDTKKVKEIFEKAINNPSMILSVESHAPDEMPVIITQSEFMRRMSDMAASGGMGFMGNMPKELNIVVNANHSIISKILKSRKEEKKTELAKQAYDLALLSQNMLDGADLTNFIQRSVQLASD